MEVAEKESKKITNSDDDGVLELFKRRLKSAFEAERDNREKGDEDMEFRAGMQWDPKVKAKRDEFERPSLVINKMPQFVQQITNEQRQNRPSIRVSPVDDKADIETAKIIQGLVRQIERTSRADAAYDTGFENAVIKGQGFWRVITEYVNEFSFKQKITIKRIRDNNTVYLDPNSVEADGSDAEWGSVLEKLSKEEFKHSYPKAKISDSGQWESYVSNPENLVEDGHVIVAEYFTKVYEDQTIILLDNGDVVPESELQKALDLGLIEVKRRKTKVYTIKWYKICGDEILETQDWAGKWIPIIPVYGNEIIVKGKKVLEGIIRHAKDSQKMYNYFASAEAEVISLAPRSPYIAAAEQIEGYEDDWENANQENRAVLRYNKVDVNGTPLPPPQRQVTEAPVIGITNARNLSNEDIKSTTGIYDASLGAKSNETSGVAIRGRQAQAQTSNYHFIDNQTRAISHTGRIVVDLIPHIYDTADVERIIGDDGIEKIVKINQEFEEDGKTRIFDFSAGTYDVHVDTGPSFATRRQEAVAAILEFIGHYPAAAPVIGDLLAKNMDFPEAQEIGERLKALVPPEVLDRNKQQIPPEAQAQMAQMQQLIQMLQGQLIDANQKLQNKTLELQSDERIAAERNQTDLIKKGMDVDSKISLALMAEELKDLREWRNSLDMATVQTTRNQNFNGSGPNEAVTQQNQNGFGLNQAVNQQTMEQI